MTRPRVVCLVGPTASGKTALALELAAACDAEIVSADSRQVYRRMDVGTAKPTPAERARVPHHVVDVVDPATPFDVARFRDVAGAAVADITARGRRVLVVGGTGLYVRALLHGLCPAPPRQPALRTRLEADVAAEGLAALHQRLRAVDPIAAARIHPNDRVRVVRALEVAGASGRPLSAWQAAHAFGDRPYEVLTIGLAVSAAELDARIDARLEAMLAAGFVDEVRALCASGLADDAQAWNAVGYRELREVVRGQATLDDAVRATRRATRQFAKRQRTWFRRDATVRWVTPDAGGAAVRDLVTAFVE